VRRDGRSGRSRRRGRWRRRRGRRGRSFDAHTLEGLVGVVRHFDGEGAMRRIEQPHEAMKRVVSGRGAARVPSDRRSMRPSEGFSELSLVHSERGPGVTDDGPQETLRTGHSFASLAYPGDGDNVAGGRMAH
jgi:hypothetical protein